MTLPVANHPSNTLLDERSDPEVRSVLEDWAMERGLAMSRLGVVIQLGSIALDEVDVDADATQLGDDAITDNDACTAAAAAGGDAHAGPGDGDVAYAGDDPDVDVDVGSKEVIFPVSAWSEEI